MQASTYFRKGNIVLEWQQRGDVVLRNSILGNMSSSYALEHIERKRSSIQSNNCEIKSKYEHNGVIHPTLSEV